MIIDDLILVQATAEKVAEQLLHNRQFVYDVLQHVDRTEFLSKNRTTLDTMLKEMAILAHNKVTIYVEGAVAAAIDRELVKGQAIIATFQDKLDQRLRDVVGVTQKDMGSTVRRALTDLLKPHIEMLVTKMLERT